MLSGRRISERELVLPALFLISLRSGITTSDLIQELTSLLQPTGEDAEILDGRSDTKFSQKVRNLVSHDTLIKPGYATYDPRLNGLHKITERGTRYLMENQEMLEYLLSNNFSYDDIKTSFDNVAEATERQRRIETYDENLMITEGTRKNRNIKLYERSKQLRDIAIKHYARDGHIKCCACTFDFHYFYGEIGRNYIEIHHLRPVFKYEDEDRTVFFKCALENLTPVCSNCHRVIHRRSQNPLAVEALKDYINKNGGFERFGKNRQK